MKYLINKKRITGVFLVVLLFSLLNVTCTPPAEKVDDLFSYAQTRTDDLRFSIYITAGAVQKFLSDEAGRREAISIFRCNGITKAFIESYRGGLVIDKTILEEVRDHFLKNNIEVVGGIATVPGKDFGVRQEAKLGWFNWQNPKTQADLEKVMRMSAEVFDEFIIDDFLCTGDTSSESKAAKGDRSWSQYRMDLLSGISEKILIGIPKSVNPDITMIIKYPQWYDRFHLFGYDVVREPAMFDKVWVGTESRGQYTQRYGFVQPYEGFVNYRWLSSLSRGKIAGAWFDHGDCDENDFIEQAYQTVLAGAREVVLFSYYAFINSHKGHHFLRRQFHNLADLAKTVAKNPVDGVQAYKPAHSDAGGDLYLMDFIGMFGVPLVPFSEYPANGKVIFLPTQAAADPGILAKVENSLSKKSTIIFTAGFLAKAKDGKKLAELAGVKWPVKISPVKANTLLVNGRSENVKYGLDLESRLAITTAEQLLKAKAGSKEIPFFILNRVDGNKIYTINTHTFSQSDFDAVGEVLLCPKPLGLLEVPKSWANTIRQAFNAPLGLELDAPTRIALQPLGMTGWVLHNYNTTTAQIKFDLNESNTGSIIDGFTGDPIAVKNNSISMDMEPRSRIWLKINK